MESEMAAASHAPLWIKVLSWVAPVLKSAQQRAAVERDARLRTYATQLRWKDGAKFFTVAIDRIFAESENQARQLSNARAAKQEPVIEDNLDQRRIVPPYVRDPSATLTQWKVTELALTDEDRALAKQGQLGPARCAGNFAREISLVALTAFLLAASGMIIGDRAIADVTIPYNEYSGSPTIGRGNGTSTNPNDAGYGALRIFIEKVIAYTDEDGPDALPAGQKVVFQPDKGTGRAVNALTAGVQFANAAASSKPTFSVPSWGFIYNSVPFGMNFEQTLGFLYDAKLDDKGRNGIELAQAMLDSRGGTQVVFPVVASTMQGSGYFPRPIGKPSCSPGDADCEAQGNGIGLAGLCTSGWRIRYLSPPEDVVSRACDLLVQRGIIPAKTLLFYPAVGGQSVLLPMQKGTIQGFEFITPVDDLRAFFPVKNPTPARPLGDPDSGSLDCGPPVGFPIPKETKSSCWQNIGQLGARYAHHPAWHQPFLLSWMNVDKGAWNGLNAQQKAAILKAAKESVVESFKATDSIACKKLKDMLDINEGVQQRNLDGTPRLQGGKPVSAKITLATWPEDALKVLREARDAYLASLEGGNPSERTDAQKDFSLVLSAWKRHAASVGANDTFTPGEFPGSAGLSTGTKCSLLSRGP
jgi:hypothetical protein